MVGETGNDENLTPLVSLSIEAGLIGDLEDSIISQEQFHQFRISRGFTNGHHGTFENTKYGAFLYIKPSLSVKDENEVRNSLKVVRYLIKKRVLYPETKLGVFKSEGGGYQLYAITRRLIGWSSKENGVPGRQKLKTGISGGYNYKGLFDKDSHVLEWYRRVDSNFEPNSKDFHPLIWLMNPFEASHSDNWAWGEDGMLYPIDVEVLTLNDDDSQKVIAEAAKLI